MPPIACFQPEYLLLGNFYMSMLNYPCASVLEPDGIHLSVIVPVFNRRQVTEIFVKSVLKQTYHNFTLYVADDSSTDGTFQFLQSISSLDKRVVPLRTSGDCWWAGTVSFGMKVAFSDQSESDLYMLMNDDISFEETLFSDMVAKYLEISRDCSICALRLDPKGRILSSGSKMISWPLALSFSIFRGKKYDTLSRNLLANIDFPNTSAILFPALLIRDTGHVNYHDLPHYHADGEYFFRAALSGYPSYIYTGACVVRHGDQSTGLFNSPQSAYLSKLLQSFYSRKSINNLADKIAFARLCCPAWCRRSYLFFSIIKSLLTSLIILCRAKIASS